MIVVADTSPLNYLIRSDHIRVLPKLFGRVLIPGAVRREMLHPKAPIEVQSFAESPPDWIECVEYSREIAGLDPLLGPGEREAISLALNVRADVILIDDLPGRIEAKARGIPARGTLAVLLQAGLRGHLDFPAAFAQLKSLGFRASRHIEEELFRLYEEESNLQ